MQITCVHKPRCTAPCHGHLNPRRDGFNYATMAQIKKGEQRRAIFLEALKRHMTVMEACRASGVTYSSYQKWRSKYPDFAAQADSTRLGARRSAVDAKDVRWRDFGEFRKLYFDRDTPPHQVRLVNTLEGAKPGTITLCLLWPGAGKSSVIEEYCCYRVTKDPNVRITLASQKITHPMKMLRSIKLRMADDQTPPPSVGMWRANYGPFFEPGQQDKGKPWAQDHIVVAQNDSHERDFTIICAGLMSAIRGTRTNLLVMDDPQDAKSLGMTSKLVDIFQDDWLTRMNPDAACVVVTNRVARNDFAGELVRRGLVDELIVIPAQNPDGTFNAWAGQPVEHFERLKAKTTPAGWAAIYQQKPRAGAGGLTESDFERALDPTRKIGQIPSFGEVPTRTVSALDPAASGFTAVASAIFTAECMWLLDTTANEAVASVEAILDLLEQQISRYRSATAVVEINAFQKHLVTEPRLQTMEKRYRFYTYGHLTNRNKVDENLGVAAMFDDIRAGRYRLPGNMDDPETRVQIGELRDECLAWEPNRAGTDLRQDRVMTLWFLWREWKKLRELLELEGLNQADPWVLRGSPVARTGVPWNPGRYAKRN